MRYASFNDFCEKCCDGLYDHRLDYDSQCNGYKQLFVMFTEGIKPATLLELEEFENDPFATPDIKYLQYLHPLLRLRIIENWESIIIAVKDLKLEREYD